MPRQLLPRITRLVIKQRFSKDRVAWRALINTVIVSSRMNAKEGRLPLSVNNVSLCNFSPTQPPTLALRSSNWSWTDNALCPSHQYQFTAFHAICSNRANTGTFQMQDGNDMEEATGEKQNCSTIYSQNKHTQEASGRKPEADVCVFLVCPAN